MMLPQLLNGIAIPAAVNLLGSMFSQTEETSKKGGSFSSVLKSELASSKSSTGSSADTAKLQERLNKLADEINKAAAAYKNANDGLTTSIVGAMNAASSISAVAQANNVKTDAAQTEKLLSTNTTPSASAPAADGHTKLIGDNPALVVMNTKDQTYNSHLDKYRTNALALNKKGLAGSNVLVGLQIPFG
jgi:hypothetical protein